MTSRRAAAQSLVEFAFIAPVLLLLVVAVWDGGAVLREQLILQESARAGARMAATGYGTVLPDQIKSAAVTAGADLPVALGDVTADAVAGTVSVSHTHQLFTPMLRRLWGNGSGTVTLRAQAQFKVPAQGPPPVSVAVPPVPCTFDINIPPLDNNKGWFSPPLQMATRADAGYFVSRLLVNWTFAIDAGSVDISLYQGNPFDGQSNPSNLRPGQNPLASPLVINKYGRKTASRSFDFIEPTVQQGTTYTVYFFNFGNPVQGSIATLTYLKSSCP